MHDMKQVVTAASPGLLRADPSWESRCLFFELYDKYLRFYGIMNNE